jgi:hypothetical protein
MPELKISFTRDEQLVIDKLTVKIHVSDVTPSEIDFAVKMLNNLKRTFTDSELVHDFMEKTS